MHVIAYPAIRDAGRRHPQARNWLVEWWRAARAERWESLHDVRRSYPAADQVGGCLVFNACGNNFRLIVGVRYANESSNGTLFIKHFLTHAEYDRDHWKKDCER